MRHVRPFCLIFICAFILSAATFLVAAESSYIRGDSNGDGKVTISDVTMIQRVITQLESDSNGDVKRRGNVTGGQFDITDATAIQRYLAEFDDPYKIGDTISYDEYELPFIPN